MRWTNEVQSPCNGARPQEQAHSISGQSQVPMAGEEDIRCRYIVAQGLLGVLVLGEVLNG